MFMRARMVWRFSLAIGSAFKGKEGELLVDEWVLFGGEAIGSEGVGVGSGREGGGLAGGR